MRFFAPEHSYIDHAANEAANIEAAREEAREQMAIILADGGIVLFDDGSALQLTNDRIDSYIRREQDEH